MVTPEVVKKIAELSRLEVSEQDVATLTTQLSAIFSHFEQLNKVVTTGVEPLVTPSPIEQFFREDDVSDEFGAEGALSNAPERQGNLFKVPPVVGD